MSQPYRTHDAERPQHPTSVHRDVPQGHRQDPTSPWKRIPLGLWIGLIAALVGYVLSVTYQSTASTNGVITQCTYYDFGAMAAAAVCVAGVGAGLISWMRRSPETRISGAVMAGLAVVVGLFGVIHVLRGLGMIGGVC